MPDDTTAAIQALMQQVASLTETVQKQGALIQGVRDHNVRLLDEVKDARRAAKSPAPDIFDKLEQEERDRKRASLNLVTQPDGSVRLASGGGDHGNEVVLTRDQARNAQAYREAKAAATSRGVPLRILDSGEDPTMRNNARPEVMKSKVFTFDDRHEMVRWLRADMQTGEGIINRRMAAEREGFKVRTFNSLDDLPAHARTIFELQEAAANAQSDS
ncbi:MAG: hypothetical protein JXR75_12420 [Rhodobacteraceae bacterium]|nr:hypothetical protein [Paracoccaceae bacterium]